MSNAVTLFDKSQLPSHVSDFFGEDGGSNIQERSTVPSLTYEGKVWTISANGEKHRLMRTNEEGDEEPLSTMRVVIVDYAKRRGRAYYPGAYDPAKPGSPTCWSDDGIAPHPSVQEKQCDSCDKCPMAVKGSKITEQGKAVTACSQHRMVVVVPANKLDFQPLRLKLAITSDWDKQNPEAEAKGWYAFQNFTDYLRARGVQHTATLVTAMKFDSTTAYPKVLFSADRWLKPEELAQIKPVVKSEAVKSLLAGTWTPAGVDGVKISDAVPSEAKPVTPPVPVKAPRSEPTKAAETSSPVVDMSLDDEPEVVEPPKATKASPKPKAEPSPAPVEASTDVPDDLADLLSQWADD